MSRSSSFVYPLFAPGMRTHMADINILDFGPDKLAGESASW